MKATDKMLGLIPSGLSIVESLQQAARDASKAYEAKGYHVVVSGPPVTGAAIQDHLQGEHTYGYIFAGHGAESYINSVEEGQGVNAQRYRNHGQRHGLAFLALLACSSAQQDYPAGKGRTVYKFNSWELNVSPSGTFMGLLVDVNLWNAEDNLIKTPGHSDHENGKGIIPQID